MYHVEPMNLHRGIQRIFDEVTSNSNPFNEENSSNNHFIEENEMLGLLHAPIEHIKETEEGLDNEMSFNSGVDIEQETTNIFKDLLNEARSELYLGCSECFSLNFLVRMMQVKFLNSWSNKSFDMMLEILKCVFPMCDTNVPSSFYKVKQKLIPMCYSYKTIHACKYDCVYCTETNLRFLTLSNLW